VNMWVVDDKPGEFDVQGFVSQAGHALGECLDAAGIDWRLDSVESRGQSSRL
jgi:hypothetical protein